MTPKNIVRIIATVLNWQSRVTGTEIAIREFYPFLSYLDKIIRSRGALSAVKTIKTVRTVTLNYLAGTPIKTKEIKMTKDCLPQRLGPLQKYIRHDETPSEYQPFIMTMQFSTRALNLGKIPDQTTITNPSSAKINFSEDERFSHSRIRSFWVAMGYKHFHHPKSVNWIRFHLTTKSGPNGHGLGSWGIDLNSHTDSSIKDLSVQGGKKFEQAIHLQRKYSDILTTGEVGVLRRITYFPDREDKVRVIAILDYFSQSVQKNLHKYLFKVLKKIPQDCTFNQGSFKDKCKDWNIYYSIDLSAATDRFPIEVICNVLRGRFTFDYVSSWRRIMTGEEFHFKNSTLNYNVGNPMGAYSSWSSFAVAHHYILYTICVENNIDWKTAKYCLLGDDIIIGDPVIAKCYIKLISDMGVEVSKLKTYTSPHFCEFAKRLVYKGVEISPFPISALSESASRVFNLAALILEVRNKGWKLPNIAFTLDEFYKSFMTFRSSQRAKMSWRGLTCSIMIDIMKGRQPASSQINTQLAGKSDLPCLTDEVSSNILQNVTVEAFADSNPFNEKSNSSKPSKPLGLLAEELQIFITGKGVEDPQVLDVIYVHPILNVYGQIEQMYLDVSKQSYRIDQLGEDWPLALRAMTLPLDDSFFTERSSKLIYRASDKISNLLEQRFEVLREFPQLL